MTPRLLILLAIVTFLVGLYLVGEPIADGEQSGTTSEQVVSWGRVSPPYVIAADMFTPPTTARARTAPSKRTTMRAASVEPVRRWPTGCTAGESFAPGPCVPAQRPCAIPAYICNRESHMTLNVWNHAGSGASGKYQFLASTWAGYGGYPYAAWAPEEVQDARALELWSSPGGHRHWGAA